MNAPLPAVVDGDGHIFEDDRQIAEYLPAPYRDQDLLFATPFFPTLDGYHRQAHRVRDGRAPSLQIPTAGDWINYLDTANVAASVLYPTAGLAFGLVKDPHWAGALASAYNGWLADRFLSLDPRRLKGMALIPLQDPDAAVNELRRAVEDLGMVGGILPAAGLHEAFGHRTFWPVFAAAEELGCLLAVHGAPSHGLGLERLHRLIEVRTLTHGFSQMVQMTSMMFEGVFDAFPVLRVAFCEAGCGWIPYLAERLDLEYEARRSQVPEVKVKPSEHLRSGRIYFHVELGERGLERAIAELGDDVLFCASDFPHEPAEEFRHAIDAFLAQQVLPERACTRILWDNAIRMYGLDESSLSSAVPERLG